MLPTPSQTVGPVNGHALPFPQGGDIAPGRYRRTGTVVAELPAGKRAKTAG